VNDKDFVNKSVREIRAYSAQRDHSSWVGTRPIFKRNVKNQLKKFWDKFFNGPIIDNKHGKIFK
jgi:hypothetical protein